MRKVKIALISAVGFASDWHPLGIALIKRELETSGRVSARNYFISSEFTDYVNRYYPVLSEINCEIGEIGTSFHEMYFSTKIFRHAEAADLIKTAVLYSINGLDLFRTRNDTYEHVLELPSGEKRYVCRIMEYCILLDKFLIRYVKNVDWQQYKLLGFSCLSSQLMTSIYTAMLIRQCGYRHPIVLGGGMFEPWNVKQYRQLFPVVDDFIVGDGSTQIMDFLNDKRKLKIKFGGIIQSHFGDFSDMPDRVLRSKYFWLPIQLTGRCTWSKCRFCGVNAKVNYPTCPEELVESMINLSEGYKISQFGFVDPNLNDDLRAFEKVISLLAASKIKFALYGMLNTRNFSKQIACLMKQAGFRHVLLGVENFSNRMLRLINKQADVIDNIKTLKWLVEQKMDNVVFNIITDFPGISKSSIIENSENIKRIKHLLKNNVDADLIEFDLERNAIAYRMRSSLGLTGLSNFHLDEIMYPGRTGRSLKFHSLKYRWRRIAYGWEKIQVLLDSRTNGTLEMSEKEGRVCLQDRRNRKITYFFDAWQGEVYKHICNKVATIKNLIKIAQRKESEIKSFLKYLLEQDLVVGYDGRYIGLALCD